MGRHSRHSAKTGDSALYRSRDRDGDRKRRRPRKGDGRSDNDAVHDEVDRYHNRKDAEREEFLRLDGGSVEDDSDEEPDDGITTGREGVFDLGVGGSDDDDDDESSSEDEDDSAAEAGGGRRSSDDDASSSSDSDESSSAAPDESEIRGLRPSEDVLDWGSRKASYYHGDTADLEIGQEEEDAELEEEAGREVLRKRMEGMDEDDFMLDEDDEGDGESEREAAKEEKRTSEAGTKAEEAEALLTGSKTTSSSSAKKLAKLSKSDRRRLLDAAHPEFLPLVEHFRDGPVRELRDVTRVLCRALLSGGNGNSAADGASFRMEDAEAVGATPAGLRYLLTKALLQTSSALNVCQYLLLKSERCGDGSTADRGDGDGDSDDQQGEEDEEDPIRSHPVISRLRELNDLSDRLTDDVESKIPDLAEQVEGLVKAARLMEAERRRDGGGNDGDDGGDDSSDSDDGSDDDAKAEAEAAAMVALAAKKKRRSAADARAEPETESGSDSSSSDEDEADARRRAAAEARFALRRGGEDGGSRRSKSERRRRPAPLAEDEYGDDDDEEAAAEDSGRKLARTVNAISQRGDARRKKAGTASGPEAVDDQDEERFRRGLEMMEADIGSSGASDKDDGSDIDDELDDGLGDALGDASEFYSKIKSKSTAKKSAKRARYAVSPKYPNLDIEVEGERAVSRAILKNRGLVAHKSKLNRNPRVKKREQYRRALVRRKGAVREVRTDEGHRYGGEGTGIKAGISRSRKIGVRR